MRQILLRLEDGTLIESVLDGGMHGVVHRYAAVRDGITLTEFDSLIEIAAYIRDAVAHPTAANPAAHWRGSAA